MVSLVLFIVSLFPGERIIEIRRGPHTKTFRAHLLGLTFGFLFTVAPLLLAFPHIPWITGAVLLLWFSLTTYFSGFLFSATLITCAVLYGSAPHSDPLAQLLAALCQWYFSGYVFGAACAIFYNDLIFVYYTFIEWRKTAIVFAYDATRRINVIKSPRAGEELAKRELLARKPHLEEVLWYKYQLQTPPSRPYTIAFVANPQIHKYGSDENDDTGYSRDPIILDRELFLRSVDRALMSLESDPIVGRPEIWSRVRIVTVFNSELANAEGSRYGMVEEFQGELFDSATGQPVTNNVVEAMEQILPANGDAGSFMNILQASHTAGDQTWRLEDFDVIYALTASPSHTRSSAHYSDWRKVPDSAALINPPNRNGTPFMLEVDPDLSKNTDKYGQPITPPNTVYPPLYSEPLPDPSYEFRMLHDFCAALPGRVALNVVAARQKTYIHEFAHAMSSFFHGTIGDEYVDCFLVRNAAGTPVCDRTPHFFINRIARDFDRMLSAAPIPVPKTFAEYNGTRYSSDLTHPSAEESWTGYFPEKFDRRTPCIMDRDITGSYRFDELLSTFIYDRMMAKTRRDQNDC